MTETLFAFDVRNYQECQKAFRGQKSQEYYLGDYSIEAGSVIDVRADKKAVGSCSIIRLRSRTRLFFKRSWSHIREDATDVTVLWFVKRGTMSVSHPGGYSIARAGDFAITQSMTPFSMATRTVPAGAKTSLPWCCRPPDRAACQSTLCRIEAATGQVNPFADTAGVCAADSYSAALLSTLPTYAESLL